MWARRTVERREDIRVRKSAVKRLQSHSVNARV
uniref:Uncharacterized protein n=1 Tax=Anopheles minimus TaxID=112268 RepID=A0A182WNI0_9DIPT